MVGVDFELPAQSRGFGIERKVNIEDLPTAVGAPSYRPPSPPIDASPPTPSRGMVHHHPRLPTPAEVDGSVDDSGSDSAVGDEGMGIEVDAAETLAVDLDLDANETTNAMMSSGCHATDCSAVDDRQRESDLDKVLQR